MTTAIYGKLSPCQNGLHGGVRAHPPSYLSAVPLGLFEFVIVKS